MQKPKIPILIVMTSAFILFLTGFFFYRNYSRDYVVPMQFVSQNQSVARHPPRRSDSTKLNINTATAEELSELPGIGETLAKRIVAYRRQNGHFQEIDQLLNVDGIGPGKLKAILDMITTQEVTKP